MRYALAAIILLLVSTSASSQDAWRGRLLHENHCTSCHTSTLHLRENRAATNRAEVKAFIERWVKTQNLVWTDEDKADVLAYLIENFYEYEK